MRTLALAIAYLDRSGSHAAAQHFRLWLMPLERVPGQVEQAMDQAPGDMLIGEEGDTKGRDSRKKMDSRKARE